MKRLLIFVIALFLGFSVYGQVDTVFTGTTANDGTGDPLKTAFYKLNTNDLLLEDRLDSIPSSTKLRAIMTDETGTGVLVFGTSPTFTTGITTPKISQTLTHSSDDYQDVLNAEWTPGAAMTSGGTNGIYSIINPVENLSNAYGLRSRVDMRDATGGVAVNQLHGIDGLMNMSDQAYTVVDNISVFGAAAHAVGITAGQITTGDYGSLNLYYGVWGPTLTKNFTVPTSGMLIVTHASTNLDYGFNIENSGAATAGLYINNHSSNSPATMVSGVLIESAASKMTYGINMTGAGITSADVLFQNGATAHNIDADTLELTETVVQITGKFYLRGSEQHADFAITDEQVPVLEYAAKMREIDKLPAFEGDYDRADVGYKMKGLEETVERLLRYIVDQEERILELEGKQVLYKRR